MAEYMKDELEGFVPKEQAAEIIKKVARGSSVMRLSKLENMTSETKKFPVMTSGAGAYWVGEGKRISTSGATWIFPEVTAKKLAVIIPVTKEKLEDSTIDVFTELQDSIAEAFYQTFDKAAIFGQNSPFATSILGGIDSVGAEVVDNSSVNLDLSASDVMAKVEDAGYEVDGWAASIGLKNRLRKLRDSSGAPIYIDGTDQTELYNQPIEFVRNGAWDKDKALAIAGEWKYSIVGVRDGISYEILKEATLQGTLDADGKPLSLAEQDMVAIKATMRIGYLCVKPEAFAALIPAGVTEPDTSLSALTVGSLSLSPTFDKSKFEYTATASVASVAVNGTATASDSVVTVEAGGKVYDNGSSVKLNMGENVIKVNVANKTYVDTYTVTVTRS